MLFRVKLGPLLLLLLRIPVVLCIRLLVPTLVPWVVLPAVMVITGPLLLPMLVRVIIMGVLLLSRVCMLSMAPCRVLIVLKRFMPPMVIPIGVVEPPALVISVGIEVVSRDLHTEVK